MASPELSLTAKLHHSFFDTFKDRGDLHFSPVVPSRLDQPTKVSSNSLLATQLGIRAHGSEFDQFEMMAIFSNSFL